MYGGESSGAKRKQDMHAYRVWCDACPKIGKTCRARVGKKRGGEAVIAAPCRLSPSRPLAVYNPCCLDCLRFRMLGLVLMI
jgi:hypothetical protein